MESHVFLLTEGAETDFLWKYNKENGSIHISVPEMKTTQEVEIIFEKKLSLNDNRELECVYELLNHAQGDNTAKETAYHVLQTGKNLAAALGEIETTGLDKDIRQAVTEIMTANL